MHDEGSVVVGFRFSTDENMQPAIYAREQYTEDGLPEFYANPWRRGAMRRNLQSSPGQTNFAGDYADDKGIVYREELHPRQPAGSGRGGQFAPKAGGPRIPSSPGQGVLFSRIKEEIELAEADESPLGQAKQKALFEMLAQSNIPKPQLEALLSGDDQQLHDLKGAAHAAGKAEHAGQVPQHQPPAQEGPHPLMSGADWLKSVEEARQHREAMSAQLDVSEDEQRGLNLAARKRAASRRENARMLPTAEQVEAAQRDVDLSQPAQFPHEMTLSEYKTRRGDSPKSLKYHKSEVRKALATGKPVPPEVLADYPELQKKLEPRPTVPALPDQPEFTLSREQAKTGRGLGAGDKTPESGGKQNLLLDEMHDLPGQTRFFGGEDERAEVKREIEGEKPEATQQKAAAEQKPEPEPLGTMEQEEAKLQQAVAERDRPKEPEKKGPYTLATAAEHAKKMRSGETSAAEIKEWFNDWHSNQDSIKQELASKSVADLKVMGAGGWHAAGMKKAELIDDMTKKIGAQYHVGDSFTYMPTQEKHADALRRHVEKQTDEDVKAFAARHAKAVEEHKERVAGAMKAIENPETLEEFEERQRYKGAKDKPLTDEQQARYDDLKARDRRSKEAANKSTVSGFRPGAAATGEVGIVEGHHKKRNQPTWTVTVEEHLGDNWSEALSRAKQLGGNYVNARIARQYGATPGFQFFSREAAEKMRDVLGGKAADRSEDVAQRKAESIENASERLAALAANTHAEADEALGKDRQTNTHRRAEHAAAAEAAARGQKALAETMERLSGAMKEGKATHLEGIRHRAHVEELNTQLRRSRWARGKAENVNSLRHDEYQAFHDKPPEEGDIKHAEYPYPQIWSDQLLQHAAALKDEPGLMRIAQKLKKTATNEVKFKTSGNKMKFNGGQVLKPKSIEEAGLHIRGIPESKGVRVHASYDWRLQKQKPDHHGAFYTADAGKSWGTTPEIAISAAIRNSHELDLIDLPQPELLTIKHPDDIADLSTAVKRLRRHSNRDLRRIGDDLSSRLDSYNRLQAMDIKNPAELRAALRDYLPLRTKPKGEDKIKRMERELRGKDIPGFFPTPQPVIERMIDAADIQPGHDVLEPSAGKGDILDVLRERHPDANHSGIEPVPSLRDIIEAKGHHLADRDFTEHKGQYDRIVMNPPFENGQDAKHVRHAYQQLKSGGRIVAVVSAGPFFRSDNKSSEFRDWLDSVGGTVEDLPEGSFAGKDAFRQTGVNTKLVVIDKE